eukprot:symbB.v1.2.019410.t1/scaffold1560.1/size111759/1
MRLADSDSESELNDIAVKIRKLPVVGILLVELCERLTYYTLAGTQKIYLQNQLKKTPSTAAALNSVFSMLCYFWCIPGGLLADSIGRYKTIIAAGCVYAVGTICVGISVIYELQSSLGWLFMLGCLVLIAIGTGGIKPNIANFGADQIGDITEKQRECQKTFFSLFYLSINIGVLIAFGFLTNTTTGGLPGVVSPSEGYSFAYGSGAGCMILAVLIFISFTNSFTMLPGNGLGPVRRLVRYQCHSLKGGGWRAFLSAAGFCCLPLFYIVTLTDTLLSARGHASAAETFHDPCSAQIDAPPRRLHGGGGGGGVLSDIALALGAMACVFLVGLMTCLDSLTCCQYVIAGNGVAETQFIERLIVNTLRLCIRLIGNSELVPTLLMLTQYLSKLPGKIFCAYSERIACGILVLVQEATLPHSGLCNIFSLLNRISEFPTGVGACSAGIECLNFWLSDDQELSRLLSLQQLPELLKTLKAFAQGSSAPAALGHLSSLVPQLARGARCLAPEAKLQWRSLWVPTLQALADIAKDGSQRSSAQAFVYLQRLLLECGTDLALPWEELEFDAWKECLEQVLFPLLQSPSKGGSIPEDVAALRQANAAQLVCTGSQ